MDRARVGAAGWKTIRANSEDQQEPTLKRYAHQFNCVEVSSTFFRVPSSHTFANWAALTPADFGFALRIPLNVIRGNMGVRDRASEFREFLATADALAEKLAVLILTLPVDMEFGRPGMDLVGLLDEQCEGRLVCQARHPTWLSPEADDQLKAQRIPLASVIGGSTSVARPPLGDRRRQYWRLHHAAGQDQTAEVFWRAAEYFEGSSEVWIICDNCRHAGNLTAALPTSGAEPVSRDSQVSTRPMARAPQAEAAEEQQTTTGRRVSVETEIFHLYFLRADQSVSHILTVEFPGCEQVFEWVSYHKHVHNIEVWRNSELVAVCPAALCPTASQKRVSQPDGPRPAWSSDPDAVGRVD